MEQPTEFDIENSKRAEQQQKAEQASRRRHNIAQEARQNLCCLLIGRDPGTPEHLVKKAFNLAELMATEEERRFPK